MHFTSKIFCFILFANVSTIICAQDLIHLYDGTILDVSIKSIESDKVYYNVYPDSLVTHSIDQSEISLIQRDTALEEPQNLNPRKQQIKFDLLGLTYNSYALGYERAFHSYASIEGYVSIRNGMRHTGYEGGLRYKMFLNRSLIKNEVSHNLLHGAYTFLTLGAGHQKRERVNTIFTPNPTTTPVTEINRAVFGGLGLGQQVQFNRFSFDGSLGYIYFVGTTQEETDLQASPTSSIVRYDNGAVFPSGNGGVYVRCSMGIQF